MGRPRGRGRVRGASRDPRPELARASVPAALRRGGAVRDRRARGAGRRRDRRSSPPPRAQRRSSTAHAGCCTRPGMLERGGRGAGRRRSADPQRAGALGAAGRGRGGRGSDRRRRALTYRRRRLAPRPSRRHVSSRGEPGPGDRDPQLRARARGGCSIRRAGTCPGRASSSSTAPPRRQRRGRARGDWRADGRARAERRLRARLQPGTGGGDRAGHGAAQPRRRAARRLAARAGRARRSRPIAARAPAGAAGALARRLATGHRPSAPGVGAGPARARSCPRALVPEPRWRRGGRARRGASAGRSAARSSRATDDAARARPVRRADLHVRRGSRPRPARRAEAGVETWFWPAARVLHHGAHAIASRRSAASRSSGWRAPATTSCRGGSGGARPRLDDAAQAVTFASRIVASGCSAARRRASAASSRRCAVGARWPSLTQRGRRSACAGGRRARRRGAALVAVVVGAIDAARGAVATRAHAAPGAADGPTTTSRPSPAGGQPATAAPASSSGSTSTACSTTAPTRPRQIDRAAAGAAGDRRDDRPQRRAVGGDRAAAPVDGVHHYDWSFDDQIAAALAAHGLRWLPILDYSAPGPSRSPATHHSPPRSPADFAAFAGGVRRSLRPRRHVLARASASSPRLPVDTYEIWNEPDNGEFWHPGPDARAIRDAVPGGAGRDRRRRPDRAGDRRRAHEPAARSCRDAPRASPTCAATSTASAIHPVRRRPAAVLAQGPRARTRLVSLGLGDVPLYVTEFGWTTHPAGSLNYAPERTAPGLHLAPRSTALGHTDCGIARDVLYTWVTPERNPADTRGLVRDPSARGAAQPDTTRSPPASARPRAAPAREPLCAPPDAARRHRALLAAVLERQRAFVNAFSAGFSVILPSA